MNDRIQNNFQNNAPESAVIHIASVPNTVLREHLVDAFTLPGFNAPIAIKFGDHHLSNQSGVPTSYVHIMFESSDAAINAVLKMDRQRLQSKGLKGLKVSMAKPSNSDWPRSTFTAKYIARKGLSTPVSNHRVQGPVLGSSGQHAPEGNQSPFDFFDSDVPREVMLKFPQVVIKGLSSDVSVDSFRYYATRELSPSPNIVAIKLGPPYPSRRSAFCAVLTLSDLTSIRQSHSSRSHRRYRF